MLQPAIAEGVYKRYLVALDQQAGQQALDQQAGQNVLNAKLLKSFCPSFKQTTHDQAQTGTKNRLSSQRGGVCVCACVCGGG